MEKVNNFDNMWDKSNNTTAFKSTTISPQHLKVLRFNHSLKVLQYNNNNIQKYCNTTTTFKSIAIQQQHLKVLQSNNNIQKYCNPTTTTFKSIAIPTPQHLKLGFNNRYYNNKKERWKVDHHWSFEVGLILSRDADVVVIGKKLFFT